MKKTPAFLACSIALTLLFYMLAYYLLHFSPTAPLVLLFAAVAMVITWAIGAAMKKFRSRGADAANAGGNPPHIVVAFLVLGLLGMAMALAGRPANSVLAASTRVCKFTSGPRAGKTMPSSLPIGSACDDGEGSSGVVTVLQQEAPVYNDEYRPKPAQSTKAEPPVEAEPAPPEPTRGSTISADSVASDTPAMPRVTGTAILLAQQKEEAGYGLYSYALISAKPTASELPKVKAYLTALLELPTAASVEQYVPRKRINITYIPLRRLPANWEGMATADQVDYVVSNYDYARAEVDLACLSKRTGPGPVIISLLKPLDPGEHPSPVLVVDLTSAEPQLAQNYVNYFKQQAGKREFWQEKALERFSLTLRNGLEVAAVGLGMSKDSVSSWVKILH